MYELKISRDKSAPKGKVLKLGISLSILVAAVIFVVATLFTPISTYSKEFVYNLAINQQTLTPTVAITSSVSLDARVAALETAQADLLTRISELETGVVSDATALPLANVQIQTIDAMGNLKNEAALIVNESDIAHNLKGWRLEREGGPTYTFGNIQLFSGGSVWLHTGDGSDTIIALYWKQSSPVWVDGSTARLINLEGEVVASYAMPTAAITSTPRATLSPDEGELYIVEAGDSILSIAERFGITMDQVMTANGLNDANFLFSGQRLMIPFSDTLPIPLAATSTPIPLTPTVIAPTPTSAPPSTATPASAGIDYELVSVNSKVTESNAIWERNSWVVTIKNNGPQTLLFNLTIEFLDKDGFILDDDTEYNLVLKPYETADYTGFALVILEQSLNTTSVNAKALVTDYE